MSKVYLTTNGNEEYQVDDNPRDALFSCAFLASCSAAKTQSLPLGYFPNGLENYEDWEVQGVFEMYPMYVEEFHSIPPPWRTSQRL